jgi:uncharacterized protein
MVDRPSTKEEEYFKKLEIERMKQLEAEKLAKMAEQERQRLRELHHMKCPKCGMDLMEIQYEGITLDRCVTCGGTWFDAGEMEHLLEERESGLVSKIMSIFK